MKKHFIPLFTTVLALGAPHLLSADSQIGIVNFATCVSDSKLGKQEQASFEALKKQMTSLLEETEKQLNDISAKLNDTEHMDGLSPEAEQELRTKFRALSEEMNRYQNQYYQVLQQANMRVFQTVSMSVAAAAEKVAKNKKLSAISHKDAYFYFEPSLDCTALIVSEMDKKFDEDAKNPPQAAPQAAPPASNP